jgi:hypothetical protein
VKTEEGSPLVKMSAYCEDVGTWRTQTLLVAEFSLSLRVRMTLRGWEFSGFFLKHTTMPCPPKGVGDTYL